MSGHEMKYIEEAFRDNWIAPLGPNVDGFEKELAAYLGAKDVAALSSGSAAIHLALVLLDVQPGDFKTQTAKDVTDVWMGKFGDKVEMILSNNDAMLLGAIEAAKSEGYFGSDAGKVMGAIGINALPEVLPLIEDGTIIGSILSDAYSEGWNIYTMAYNVATGKDVYTGINIQPDEMKAIRVPYIPISKDNLQVAKDMYEKALK